MRIRARGRPCWAMLPWCIAGPGWGLEQDLYENDLKRFKSTREVSGYHQAVLNASRPLKTLQTSPPDAILMPGVSLLVPLGCFWTLFGPLVPGPVRAHQLQRQLPLPSS